MQRHTYMLSPMSYQHYNGGGVAQNIEGQHHFSLFNPFALAQNEPVPTQNIQPNPNVISTNSLEFKPKSKPTVALNHEQRKPLKKVHMPVKPVSHLKHLKHALSASKTEPSTENPRSRKLEPKIRWQNIGVVTASSTIICPNSKCMKQCPGTHFRYHFQPNHKCHKSFKPKASVLS